jgi:hypothetical protein
VNEWRESGGESSESDGALRPPLDRAIGRSVFGADPAGYDSARSDYPGELYEAIRCRTPTRPSVAEIGAGTGLATVGLITLAPSRLVLIEPDPGMAGFLSTRFEKLGAEIVCAPFSDASIAGRFDLVACAAAFHWLDTGPALAKVRDLLMPGGTWAVWWNSYFGHGLVDPFGERVGALLLQEGIALPPSYTAGRHNAFDVRTQIGYIESAGFEDVRHEAFSAPRSFTPEQARALYGTFSFIQVLEGARRDHVLDAVAEIVAAEFGGLAPGVCATALYLAQAPKVQAELASR